MERPRSDIPREWNDWIAAWGSQWGVAGLERRVSVALNPRLRTTLGRCHPDRGQLSIATRLLDAPHALVREVVCHEAAHAAAYELYGRGKRPHGVEWRDLMRAAGLEARVRIPASELPAVRHTRTMWEHRCPACQTLRMARRSVPQWRCATCRRAGREGGLTITRLAAPGGATG